MSDPAEDRDGKLTHSIPPPSRWLPDEPASAPADEWVAHSDAVPDAATPPDDATGDAPAPLDTPDPLPGDTSAPVLPEPIMPEPTAAEPDAEAPFVDEPAPLTPEPLIAVPLPAEPLPAEPLAAEPLPADPVQAPAPVADAPPLLTAVPDPTPSLDLPPDPEPMPTVFETVTESTFTSEPEPAVAFAAEPTTPEAPSKVGSIMSEHPEYLIVAALIGGFVLAKVVKKLAS